MSKIETKEAFFVNGKPFATQEGADNEIKKTELQRNINQYLDALTKAGYSSNVVTRAKTVLSGYSVYLVDGVIPAPKQKEDHKPKAPKEKAK